MFVGKKTRQHQQRLTRQGQSHALSEKSEQQRPIAPITEELTDLVIEPVHGNC